jgi:hypothetical protein
VRLWVQYWILLVILFLPVGVHGLHISFRYPQVLGNKMNTSMCGMLQMYLSAMWFQLHTVTACHIPQGETVLTSFFSQKQNRNIDINITHHYNWKATANLRGKLWICKIIWIRIINPLLQLGICNFTTNFLLLQKHPSRKHQWPIAETLHFHFRLGLRPVLRHYIWYNKL